MSDREERLRYDPSKPAHVEALAQIRAMDVSLDPGPGMPAWSARDMHFVLGALDVAEQRADVAQRRLTVEEGTSFRTPLLAMQELRDAAEKRAQEAEAASAAMREALEAVHVDGWCIACTTEPGVPCRALASDIGCDELERRQRAEHNLALAEAVVAAARDEIAEDQSECAGLIAAVAAYDAGRRK